ncbi:Uncharacterised protein [Mycobacterium tuberculosis]|nr:Uncharacterised protein [Mycobacterium tuberculosis]
MKRVLGIDSFLLDVIKNNIYEIRILKRKQMRFEYFGFPGTELRFGQLPNRSQLLLRLLNDLPKALSFLLRIRHGHANRYISRFLQPVGFGNGQAGRSGDTR